MISICSREPLPQKEKRREEMAHQLTPQLKLQLADSEEQEMGTTFKTLSKVLAVAMAREALGAGDAAQFGLIKSAFESISDRVVLLANMGETTEEGDTQ